MKPKPTPSSETAAFATPPPPETASACPAAPSGIGAPALAPAPDESPRAFEAFCAYLELGPHRRYSAVARQVGVSVRTIERWAVQFDWRERLTARAAQGADLFVQVRNAGLRETAVQEQSLRERQLVLAESIVSLTERYFERLDDMDLERVRLPEVCRALELASRLVGPPRDSAPAAPADAGLRDQLATLLAQAFRETPTASTPGSPPPPPAPPAL